MRGLDERSGELFSYVDLERRVPARHPLRAIRVIVNEALAALDEEFQSIYASTGRPSIPPEKLLRALLLQLFHGIRSERQMMERLDFDLSFRWFVGLGIDDAVWDASTFSKNRERLLDGDIAAQFLAAILARPQVTRLLSSDHFSVDGTLIEAWCSMKSFRPKEAPDVDGPPPDEPAGRNVEVDFRGEKRGNATHASTTDPDALLYRKSPGTGAKLCYMGHVLMENRNGLVVDAETTRVSGHAERLAALEMIDGIVDPNGSRRITIGADKGFDTRDFVAELRERKATPHIAQNQSGRRSAIDGRTTRHPGYSISLRIRKRIEEVFGWAKSSAGQAKTRFRGLPRVRFAFTLTVAAYNLIRLPKLLEAGR
ncbi:MAG TPA: IS5 family transposase [Xanthobacteraceae bacterium]|nr:IS5 family transposase [Xanthobacteraceae bacterium]